MALVNVEADSNALALSVCRRIADLVTDAQHQSGGARLCLTGGQTPRQVYALLGERRDLPQIDWSRVDLFWGDERHVPPDHADSNFGMANGSLLKAGRVPPDHVHRIRGELPDAQDAAREYDEVIRRYERHPAPTFDVMLLGLGADAHIASLFPDSPMLARRPSDPARGPAPPAPGSNVPASPRAVAVPVPHLNAWRITLTPRAVLDSGTIIVLTSGAGKADAVHAALHLPEDIQRWPAQLLRSAGNRVEWWMDRDAAAKR